MVSGLIELVRASLHVFLYVLASACGLLLAGLLVSRAFEALAERRRGRLVARYQPIVHALLSAGESASGAASLTRIPARHQALVGELLLAVLRPTRGAVMPSVLAAANALALPQRWAREVRDRRWWVRARGVRALAAVQHDTALETAVEALDDAHEEVRAAAVDALGRIGDARGVTVLIRRLHDDTRHQRARVVDALKLLGPAIVPALTEYAQTRPDHVASTIDVLGMIGATAAIDDFLGWSGDADPRVRAAAMRALGSIGLDDRSFYYALRGLEDVDAGVRAMAARALGRSGRGAAAGYLGPRLTDEWEVAAQAATGLRRLGGTGRTELDRFATAPGHGGVLARQMLWELDRRSGM
jgi:hypothetical protein